MNKKNDFFYRWFKNITEQSPPKLLDQKILIFSKEELNHSKKSIHWIMPTSAISFCLILFVVGNTYFLHQKNLNMLFLSEAPEMILNYDNIELMADASELNADDWKKIEGSK